jgi:hypothetical protein
MAKSPRTCDRLLMVLVNRNGVVTESDIATEMQYDSMYRISTEFWRLKKRGAVIKTVRDGRKVAGYELVNVDEMKSYLNDKGFASFATTKAVKAPKVATVKAPKAPAKPKATKVAKAPAAVAPVAEVKEAAPVDVLDAIDTDITDFEDREFAQDFVDGKM